MRLLLAALLIASSLSAIDLALPTDASAQRRVRIGTPHAGDRPLQLDLHAGFPWWHRGFATGARFGIPVMENGFVPSINNAVYINFGMDLYFIRYRFRGNCGPDPDDRCSGVGIGFPVTMHWEFYFTEHWSAFGEAGLNPFFHPRYYNDGDNYLFDGRSWFIFQVGGRFWFDDSIAITGRIGSPYFSFGVSFFF